jgi:hypothetical protein
MGNNPNKNGKSGIANMTINSAGTLPIPEEK